MKKVKKQQQAQSKISIAPDGTKYPLPREANTQAEFTRIKELVEDAKQRGMQIVVVQGQGFVGAMMAAIVADAKGKFVIGLQRPSRRSFWKIPMLNAGISPIASEDPEVAEGIARTVLKKKTYTVTWVDEVLSLADVVVVDVQCDVVKPEFGNAESATVEIEACKSAIQTIGEYIRPEALVMIETTVPPGFCEYIAKPILEKEFTNRGINLKKYPIRLAHSYERVMPGKDYWDSIVNFPRVYSGIDETSAELAGKFLAEVLTGPKAKLSRLPRTTMSEFSKCFENSYRASLLAFGRVGGWLAELMGVDLTAVKNAIAERPTHRDIMVPHTPSTGGYCLPKDAVFLLWSARNIPAFYTQLDAVNKKKLDGCLRLISLIVDINDTSALRMVDLAEQAVKSKGKKIKGMKIAVLGAAYREDVGDTRYASYESIVRRLQELGAKIAVGDPYVKSLDELSEQDRNPHSMAFHFKNQALLKNLKVSADTKSVLCGAEVILFVVPHQEYLEIAPDGVIKATGKPAKSLVIVDCGTLDDEKIAIYLKRGCRVKKMYHGHI
ncbi:MAG: UDP binding domain-containing protein [bacterium]|nr:UDP binding domain-containing protein [bacterium]